MLAMSKKISIKSQWNIMSQGLSQKEEANKK